MLVFKYILAHTFTWNLSVPTYIKSACLGEESVERLASGLGGRMVAPEVLKHVETYSGHQQWKYRVAAVVAVSRLIEGCPQYFEKNYLVLAKQFYCKMLQDPSPIVKYEVIQVSSRNF